MAHAEPQQPLVKIKISLAVKFLAGCWQRTVLGEVWQREFERLGGGTRTLIV